MNTHKNMQTNRWRETTRWRPSMVDDDADRIRRSGKFIALDEAIGKIHYI